MPLPAQPLPASLLFASFLSANPPLLLHLPVQPLPAQPLLAAICGLALRGQRMQELQHCDGQWRAGVHSLG